MLEEWAWDAEVLRTFATDADGRPIPATLVERMRAANEFGKGTYALAEPPNVAAEEARAEKAESKPRPRGRKKQTPTA